MNFVKNARKSTFNRWGMLMQIILAKFTLYVTEKCQQNKNFTIPFPGKTPFKLKQMPKNFKHLPSRTCCKHSRPLPYYYWPVIAVLEQCADEMITVQSLIRPIPKEQADFSVHCFSIGSIRKLRVFTVDILTLIVLMYFIRNNNSNLFQQIKID